MRATSQHMFGLLLCTPTPVMSTVVSRTDVSSSALAMVSALESASHPSGSSVDLGRRVLLLLLLLVVLLLLLLLMGMSWCCVACEDGEDGDADDDDDDGDDDDGDLDATMHTTGP